MNTLNLSNLNVIELSFHETTNINGGETIAGGYNNDSFNAFANGVATGAGIVAGFFHALFS